eukprot:scaffold68200_cov63-Phaeocystis_antarctica.AAC.6
MPRETRVHTHPRAAAGMDTRCGRVFGRCWGRGRGARKNTTQDTSLFRCPNKNTTGTWDLCLLLRAETPLPTESAEVPPLERVRASCRPWLGDVAADGRRLQLPEGQQSHMSAPDDLHRVAELHRRTSAQAVVEATITRRKTAQAAALAADERVLKALSDAFEAAQQPLSADEQRGLTSVAATII